MKRFFLLCSLSLLLLPLLLAAEDVTGTWTGTVLVLDKESGSSISTPVEIKLDQSATTISGKVGRAHDSDSVPIQNAKREGDTITFEAVSAETASPVKFVLTVKGDQMEGSMKTSLDSQDLTGTVKVTRGKT